MRTKHMPAVSKTAVATPPRSRPTTRNTIRQSLNLASMSKALVDVISKDIKDSTKNARKTKDSSRRSSVLSPRPQPPLAAPRTSMGEVRPFQRTATPESKTITRRRVSGSYTRSSSDDPPQKVISQEHGTSQSSVHRANSVLRPKNVTITKTTSALPKYRPKTNNDSSDQNPPSPVKVGTRRRLSSSDDDKKERSFVLSAAEKRSRPISPLPHRAALKTNVNSINVISSPTTPSKTRAVLPSSGSKISPLRPSKIVKTTALPRPPSSTSSVSSFRPPNTPKSVNITPTRKFEFSRSGSNVENLGGGTPSKMANSSFSRDSPSPLSRHLGQSSKLASNPFISHNSGDAGESEDSDLEDVELLLAPIASLGAPTPAMPRIQVSKKRANPHTPSKSRLPKRENLSYVSPELPKSDKKNSSLTPPIRPFNSDAPRGSILSWEQLASEASRTIGEDEFGRMLADIPAPFRSGPASPALSTHIGLPDSPGLSVIDSPGGGYGSISQVLLPDVTPSPAVNQSSIQQAKFYLNPDASKLAVDSSTATLLRLQLVSMENIAKERLKQLQAMEEEMHNVKQAHAQQIDEMRQQTHYLEAQNRHTDERVSNMFKKSLEERLRQQKVVQEEAFRQAMSEFQDESQRKQDCVLDSERAKMATTSLAGLASFKWASVASICEDELEYVRSDRAMLAFLHAQVDQMSMALTS